MRLSPSPQQLLDVKYVQQQTLEKFGFSRMLSPFYAKKVLSTLWFEDFLVPTSTIGLIAQLVRANHS